MNGSIGNAQALPSQVGTALTSAGASWDVLPGGRFIGPTASDTSLDACGWVCRMANMSSLAALADRLYAEEVKRARAMEPADKLLEGPRLFERACRLMMDGIRHQHPELDEDAVRSLLLSRLAHLHAIERQ